MPTSTSRRRRWIIVSERNSSTPKWAKAVASRGISETRKVVAFRSRSSSKNWKLSFRGLSKGARAYSASRLSSAIRSHPISSLYRASWRRRPRSHRGCSRTSSISRRNARTSMMWTPFAYPGSMPSEVICEMSEVRLCSIERYNPDAPCSFASWKRMRYTNDDFREPGGPATSTMCPRGMPPLRRSSKPTTYVGILSVACDRMEPLPTRPPVPGKGPQPIKRYRARSTATIPDSRPVQGQRLSGRRPSRGPTEPLNVSRSSGGDSGGRDGRGRSPVWGRRQGEDRRLPCRPRGRRCAVPGRRERRAHGPSGRPAVRVPSLAIRGPAKAHDERHRERSGRRSGAAPERDRRDACPWSFSRELAHQRSGARRDAVPQDDRRPRGETERRLGSRDDASGNRPLIRGQGGPVRDPHVRPRGSGRPPGEARDGGPDQAEANGCVQRDGTP